MARRLTGRSGPKPVSLIKKKPRRAPPWVGRLFARRKKKATAATAPTSTTGSPVAQGAINDALKGAASTGRRKAEPGTPAASTPRSTSTTTSTGSSTAMPGNPFAAVIEACGQAAQGYSPDNALRVTEWFEAMPDLVDAISAMLKAQGGKTVEEFYLYPAAGDFAAALGQQFLHFKGPCEVAHDAFERAHEPDLARIRDPQRNQERWDISANRE